ncbi:intraflagellar transport protein 20 [Chytriomyces cf. hyalinus JEL632]|nr:intraflagellar transport protein 20 [Chytriomyces cf. hyalinus JEL632]
MIRNSEKDSLGVTFDEFSKIRILPSDQFEASDSMKDQCKEFTQQIEDFNSIVQIFLEMLQAKAEQIEAEKLKAIGLRNRVETELETRKAKRQQLQLLIKERHAELHRLKIQSDSLENVSLEQLRLIEQLSSK